MMFVFTREEVKVAVIIWCSCVLKTLFPSIQEALPILLDTLYLWCDDSSPVNVRIEIAHLLGRNWSCLVRQDICRHKTSHDTMSAYDTSQSAYDTSQSAYDTSQSAYDTSQSVYDTSQSAYDTSQSAYDTSQSAYDTSQSAYDTSQSGSCIKLYWSMVMILLQDVEELVRSAMCTSLQSLINEGN